MAKYLERNYGYRIIHFATPLKRMAEVLLEHLYGENAATDFVYNEHLKNAELSGLGVTPRHIMQTLGTNWGRGLIHPDVWVKAAFGVIDALPTRNRWVIDDMRFTNEYAAIRGHGGQCWRIQRPGVIPDNAHPSEGLLETEYFDANIYNRDSLDRLYADVDAVMARTYTTIGEHTSGH